MDDRSFDQLTRALGGASTRRSALVAFAGLLAGDAALDAEARRKRGDRRDDAKTAGKRKNKKRCKPECTGNFSCVKQQCVCETVSCGSACCAEGQVCQRGRCVGQGAAICHDLAAACGDGTPCCTGLVCGSGNGGGPVACWPEPGGECESDAECLYGHHCANGACVVDAPPEPQPEPGAGPTPPAGATCPAGQTDCTGTCADLATDESHCGACGTACAGGETCCGGTCRNLQTDNANCGTCGTACTGGKTCKSGACVAAQQVASLGTKAQATGDTDGKLFSPKGMHMDAARTTMWIADGNPRIAIWEKQSGEWNHTGSFAAVQPQDIVVNAAGDKAWVVDWNNSSERITIWDKLAGIWTAAGSFGTSGSTSLTPTDGKLSSPSSVALSADETTVWVADRGNNRIVEWKLVGSTWTHLSSFGTYGGTSNSDTLTGTDGLLSDPSSLVVRTEGTDTAVYVTDQGNGRVVIWKRPLAGGQWTHAASFGTGTYGAVTGPTDGLMVSPRGMTLSADGTKAWIADVFAGRVVAWQLQGGTWSHTGSFGTSATSSFTQTDGTFWQAVDLDVSADFTTALVLDSAAGRVAAWEI